MSRPPSYSHPLQDVRAVISGIYGKRAGTQEEFASFLGAGKAAVTIKKIEAGSLKLSRNLAALITAATGVDTTPMLRGRLDRPRTLDGKTFDADSLRQWTCDIEPGRADELAAHLGGLVVQLAKLAHSKGGAAALRKTYCELSAVIGKKQEELAVPQKGKLSRRAESVFPGVLKLWECTQVPAASENARRSTGHTSGDSQKVSGSRPGKLAARKCAGG